VELLEEAAHSSLASICMLLMLYFQYAALFLHEHPSEHLPAA
jgi:hypothetical protein